MLPPTGISRREGADPGRNVAGAPEVPSQSLQGAVVSQPRAAPMPAALLLTACLRGAALWAGRVHPRRVLDRRQPGTASLDAWKRRRLKKASPGAAVGCARPPRAALRRVSVPRLKGGSEQGTTPCQDTSKQVPPEGGVRARGAPPPPAHPEPRFRIRVCSLPSPRAEQRRPLSWQMPHARQREGFVITCYLIWSPLAFPLRRTVLQAHSGTMSH